MKRIPRASSIGIASFCAIIMGLFSSINLFAEVTIDYKKIEDQQLQVIETGILNIQQTRKERAIKQNQAIDYLKEHNLANYEKIDALIKNAETDNQTGIIRSPAANNTMYIPSPLNQQD